jgi:hypothetical protein
MTDALGLSPYLEAIALDLAAAAGRAVARRRRRRPIRIAALALAAIALVAGTALAGSSLLGGSAPGPIQAAIDAAYPHGDDTFAPAQGGARVMAQFGDDILYRLPARDGEAICLTITIGGADGAIDIPGVGCIASGVGDQYWPIGLEATSGQGRELVYGRVNAPPGGTLALVRPGTDELRIPLGVDGFFLWETPMLVVPASTPMSDRSPVIGSLVLRDAAGATLSSMRLQGMAVVTGSPSAP